LLESEPHRAGPLHATGGDEGCGDARADDEQTVIAQDQDLAVTKIGEEASSFFWVSAGALVIVVSDVDDYLQRMLVEREQPVPLHRYGTAGNRVGVEHVSDSRPRHVHRARHREAAAIDLGF
jgi:hypothetical protein